MRIGGVAEVAQCLGVSRQRLLQLRHRPDFPAPVARLAQGEVWDLSELEAWQSSGFRTTLAGRPSAADARQVIGGRFVIEGPPIGGGGFADVYRAVDRRRPGPPPIVVAVKVLRGSEELHDEVRRRFLRELRLMETGLSHPHVVPLLAHSDLDETPLWYAMPLAVGSLADRAATITTPAEFLDLMRQVCDGLAYVHASGIFHRDLKPANILRTTQGAWVLADFGLAAEVERKTTVLTSTLRAGLGSFWYTAPEQWRNARAADARSDIYSLGKILQELVTGEAPVGDDIPPSPFRPIILKAVNANPSKRYQSVADFFGALQRTIGASTSWDSLGPLMDMVAERLGGDAPEPADIEQFLTWAEHLNRDDSVDMQDLTRVFTSLSQEALALMWEENQGAFRSIYDTYAHYVAATPFSFHFCDVLADAASRIVLIANDPEIMHLTMSALPRLGAGHNRWHVQAVIVSLLQQIRDPETATAALEGLRESGISDVAWAINGFATRTLQPILRDGLRQLLDAAS